MPRSGSGRDLQGTKLNSRVHSAVFKHQPRERRTHRNAVFTDGRVLMWEYPRATPDGDQMDFTEVMELESGMIKRHRVYWGWYGVRTLTSGSHAR
jgi:hypothetical protein